MNFTQPDRRVVTFYSFKGGVGRTMALANVAYRMADTHALDVIAVDWDLEAPGLHKYFGLTNEQMAETRGVLDYFIEWQEAVERKDAKPPDVTPWLIPIINKAYAPRYGSLSLLVAARMDRSYDKRLAAFDWQTFYAEHAGAAAVETLRAQLVAGADVVFVDSRTGFTDPGGICTVQLPDALLLMTAPNEQSLEGVERVAFEVANADKKDRAGRPKPRTWLSVCRVPSVDESYLADKWFEDHKERFEKGLTGGLWAKADHPEGLRTYEIPHRGRWGFGEVLVRKGQPYVDVRDPLAGAYDLLTKVIFYWASGEISLEDIVKASSTDSAELEPQIAELRGRVNEAKQRGDVPGLIDALSRLGLALFDGHRYDDAIPTLERAESLALGQGDRSGSARIGAVLALALDARGHLDRAVEAMQESISIFRELGSHSIEARLLVYLSLIYRDQRKHDSALEVVDQAKGIYDADSNKSGVALALKHRSWICVTIGRLIDASNSIRECIDIFREIGNAEEELDALELLLSLELQGFPLPDAPALKARRDELMAKKSGA